MICRVCTNLGPLSLAGEQSVCVWITTTDGCCHYYGRSIGSFPLREWAGTLVAAKRTDRGDLFHNFYLLGTEISLRFILVRSLIRSRVAGIDDVSKVLPRGVADAFRDQVIARNKE